MPTAKKPAESDSVAQLDELRSIVSAIDPHHAEAEAAIDRANVALAQLHGAVIGAILIDRIEPTSVSTLVEWDQIREQLPGDQSFVAALISHYDQVVDSHAELELLFRSPRVTRLLRRSARAKALSDPASAAELERREMSRYATAIAQRQLVRGRLLPHTDVLVNQLPPLVEQLTNLQREHKAFLSAEEERRREETRRREEERKAAVVEARERRFADVLVKRTTEQRELVERLCPFYERQDLRYFWRTEEGELVTGPEIAARLRRGDSFDFWYRKQGAGEWHRTPATV